MQTGTYVGTTAPGYMPGKSAMAYDMFGDLSRKIISENSTPGSAYTLETYTYNLSGQILTSGKGATHWYSPYDGSNFATGGQTRIYQNGAQLAAFKTGASSNQGPDIFDFNAPTTATSVSATPGSYVVTPGSTLGSIANAVYGDASFWYLIADANGIQLGRDSDLSATYTGRSLTIPSVNTNIRNNATSFKPFNPSDVIGNTTPSVVGIQYPPPTNKSCDAIAIILVVVITVIATIVTAGAAAMAMGAAGAGIGTGVGAAFTAGTAALSGTVAAGASTLATMAAAAIGGFVGSVAGQLAGRGLGTTDTFSLKQAVFSGLTAGFGSGAGALLQGAGEGWAVKNAAVYGQSAVKYSKAGYAALGAMNYAGVYVSNVAIDKPDTNFNWTDLAIASTSSSLSGVAGERIGTAVAGIGKPFMGNVVSNYFGSAASASLSHMLGRGDRPDWTMMAVDAFGNASASAVAQILTPTPTQQEAQPAAKDGVGQAQKTLICDNLVETPAENMPAGQSKKDPVAKLTGRAAQSSARAITSSDVGECVASTTGGLVVENLGFAQLMNPNYKLEIRASPHLPNI